MSPRPTAAQHALTYADALARGQQLVQEIRDILAKAKPPTKLTYRQKLTFLLGGPGSGNFGHAGRPGERGGSAEGDGAAAGDGNGNGDDDGDVQRGAAVTQREVEEGFLHRLPPQSTVASIKAYVKTVSERMGFDRYHVDVVDKPPRKFEVNGRVIEEGAHYSPRTGRIEINVQANADDNPTIGGLVAHEIMHAQDDAVHKAVELERDEMRAVFERADTIWQQAGFGQNAESKRLFDDDGFPRKEHLAEIEKRWPLSAAMAKYAPEGDKILGSWTKGEDGKWAHDSKAITERDRQMEKEDGFTGYSRLYWEEALYATTREDREWKLRRAKQETAAEVAKYLEHKRSGAEWKQGTPSQRWIDYAESVRENYEAANKKVRKADKSPLNMPERPPPPGPKSRKVM